MKTQQTLATVVLTLAGMTSDANAQLPDPSVELVPNRTALLITDSSLTPCVQPFSTLNALLIDTTSRRMG